jgi:hypothetical protein
MSDQPTRRTFIGAVSAVGATASLSDAADATLPRCDMSQTEADHFVPLIGDQFRIKTEAGSLSLTLSSVDKLSRINRPVQFRDPFSLLFRGTGVPTFPQQTLEVRHPKLGCFEGFMVPVGTDGEDALFEMIYG